MGTLEELIVKAPFLPGLSDNERKSRALIIPRSASSQQLDWREKLPIRLSQYLIGLRRCKQYDCLPASVLASLRADPILIFAFCVSRLSTRHADAFYFLCQWLRSDPQLNTFREIRSSCSELNKVKRTATDGSQSGFEELAAKVSRRAFEDCLLAWQSLTKVYSVQSEEIGSEELASGIAVLQSLQACFVQHFPLEFAVIQPLTRKCSALAHPERSWLVALLRSFERSRELLEVKFPPMGPEIVDWLLTPCFACLRVGRSRLRTDTYCSLVEAACHWGKIYLRHHLMQQPSSAPDECSKGRIFEALALFCALAKDLEGPDLRSIRALDSVLQLISAYSRRQGLKNLMHGGQSGGLPSEDACAEGVAEDLAGSLLFALGEWRELENTTVLTRAPGTLHILTYRPAVAKTLSALNEYMSGRLRKDILTSNNGEVDHHFQDVTRGFRQACGILLLADPLEVPELARNFRASWASHGSKFLSLIFAEGSLAIVHGVEELALEFRKPDISNFLPRGAAQDLFLAIARFWSLLLDKIAGSARANDASENADASLVTSRRADGPILDFMDVFGLEDDEQLSAMMLFAYLVVANSTKPRQLLESFCVWQMTNYFLDRVIDFVHRQQKPVVDFAVPNVMWAAHWYGYSEEKDHNTCLQWILFEILFYAITEAWARQNTAQDATASENVMPLENVIPSEDVEESEDPKLTDTVHSTHIRSNDERVSENARPHNDADKLTEGIPEPEHRVPLAVAGRVIRALPPCSELGPVLIRANIKNWHQCEDESRIEEAIIRFRKKNKMRTWDEGAEVKRLIEMSHFVSTGHRRSPEIDFWPIRRQMLNGQFEPEHEPFMEQVSTRTLT